PAQPPAQPQTQPQPQSQPPAPSTAPSGQIDANAAKQHLTEARDALSQMASMPAAAKLQGDARTKVSDLISNFNALITTQGDWRSSYAKVSDSLTALLGPDTDQNQSPSQSQGATAGTGSVGTTGTGATGSAGTTGTAPAAAEPNASGVQLDPAIHEKLVEFRTHLKEFEKAAGGAAQPSPSAAAAPANTAGTTASSSSETGSMPPAAATASTSNPANPATAVSGATGTSGREQTKPEPTGTTGTTAAAASGSADQNVSSAAQSELAAIDAILAKSNTGALTKTQTAELRRHVDALRSLLNQK
ncbi:MAG TPA: hypothetical protein VKT77_18070, partial [Chthonomonadaceae bacterium]|nr:hypothetical protein [Chthonomonadaceae bacterium]